MHVATQLGGWLAEMGLLYDSTNESVTLAVKMPQPSVACG
jgi:hypothetical protein